MTNGLTFAALRGANKARLPQFKNRHGDAAHEELDGSDWSPAQWLQAIVGELGEYANLRKKYERGDITGKEFMEAAAKELADVQTYLDILALQLDIDLGDATIAKFNEVSERVGSSIRLLGDRWDDVREPGDFRRGDVVRWGNHSTALMRIDYANATTYIGSGFDGERLYCKHSDARRPSSEDLELWNNRG